MLRLRFVWQLGAAILIAGVLFGYIARDQTQRQVWSARVRVALAENWHGSLPKPLSQTVLRLEQALHLSQAVPAPLAKRRAPLGLDWAALPASAPVSGAISKLYDAFRHPWLDLRVAPGAPVQAVWSGRVLSVGNTKPYGREVVLQGGGWQLSYRGLGWVAVRPGQQVARGQTIGDMAEVGPAVSSVLRLELRDRGRPVNPLNTSLARALGAAP